MFLLLPSEAWDLPSSEDKSLYFGDSISKWANEDR